MTRFKRGNVRAFARLFSRAAGGSGKRPHRAADGIDGHLRHELHDVGQREVSKEAVVLVRPADLLADVGAPRHPREEGRGN